MVAPMRRSFMLLLPGSALLLALSGACGGNVVLDGQGGSGGAMTSTSVGTTGTSHTVTSTGAGAGPTNPGTGGATSCISCASRFMEFESGVKTSLDPVCAGSSQDAFNALLSCACSSSCASACAVNACVHQAITMSCVDCLAQSCSGPSSVCNSN